MVGTENIKSNLINVIQGINDDNLLLKLFKQAVSYKEEKTTNVPKRVKETLPLSDAKTEIRENVTFEQILEEQSHKKGLKYESFKALQEEDWEYTLDELLAGLD